MSKSVEKSLFPTTSNTHISASIGTRPKIFGHQIPRSICTSHKNFRPPPTNGRRKWVEWIQKMGDFDKHQLITSVTGYGGKNVSRTSFLHRRDLSTCKVWWNFNGSFTRSSLLPPPSESIFLLRGFKYRSSAIRGPPRPRTTLRR